MCCQGIFAGTAVASTTLSGGPARRPVNDHAAGRPDNGHSTQTGQAPSRYPAVAASRIMISLYRGCTLPMRTSTRNPGCALSSKSLRLPRTNMP